MARAGLTADRVVAAAAELADSVGLDAVTLSALARGFGVKDASLYSHVSNLRDLRSRLAVRSAAEFSDRLGTALAGRSGKAALAGFAEAYRAYAVGHPGRYAATQLELPPETLAASPGHLRLVEYTYALLRSYDLDEPDRTDAVRLLRSTFHGFAALEAAAAFRAERDLDASWNRMIDALDTLLAGWPAASASPRVAP
ncbi:TetR/AcrR family transcriptional regulator [Streptomyces sp. NPDC093225]|uniref:TetR/AcrR family transcriptional regulator n=1 Tax=Streptomyces sp. NPDC093225 TaxID=3366034 RepID=UPI00381513CA